MFRDTYSSSYDDTKVDYDEEIKIIVLGETGVGKSNIIIRYGGGQFDPNSVPNSTSSYIVKYYTFGILSKNFVPPPSFSRISNTSYR